MAGSDVLMSTPILSSFGSSDNSTTTSTTTTMTTGSPLALSITPISFSTMSSRSSSAMSSTTTMSTVTVIESMTLYRIAAERKVIETATTTTTSTTVVGTIQSVLGTTTISISSSTAQFIPTPDGLTFIQESLPGASYVPDNEQQHLVGGNPNNRLALETGTTRSRHHGNIFMATAQYCSPRYVLGAEFHPLLSSCLHLHLLRSYRTRYHQPQI